ncbi:MAG: hypothetical protein IIU39_01370 [Ruminococcus sp.]|nr:hypothetical protein [Ruminococcus sp.]
MNDYDTAPSAAERMIMLAFLALAEEGLIETNGGGNTSVISVNAKLKRVVILNKEVLKEVINE